MTFVPKLLFVRHLMTANRKESNVHSNTAAPVCLLILSN